MTVITISRQYGSGGTEIAARVCELLGYHFFDKRLVAQIASKVGLADHEIVDFSEDNYKVRNFLERLFDVSRAVASLDTSSEAALGFITTVEKKLDEADSINLVQTTVLAAYQRGNIVVVGRGGQAILKDKLDALHVRIEAPYRTRVQHLHERDNYGLGGAKDAAVKHDEASAEYLRRFYDIDWANPMLYDLVINTGKLSFEGASQLIASAVGYLPQSTKSSAP